MNSLSYYYSPKEIAKLATLSDAIRTAFCYSPFKITALIAPGTDVSIPLNIQQTLIIPEGTIFRIGHLFVHGILKITSNNPNSNKVTTIIVDHLIVDGSLSVKNVKVIYKKYLLL